MKPSSDADAAPPLNPGLYKLDAESLAFFKSTTGIQDDDQLKEHILDVQARAYAVRAQGGLFSFSVTHLAFQVVPYPCIRFFSFTRYARRNLLVDHTFMSHVLARVAISKVSAYNDVLKLGQEREGALFLDLGCGCTSLRHPGV